MPEQPAIESMPLYVNVDRINHELAALGIGNDEALTPAQLFPFDQYHYHGTDAVHAAAYLLGLGPTSQVLDVGSGLGGPARDLASTIGCHVTALELQRELHALATRLTARCGLGQHITHVCADALTAAFPEATFDAVVSWLTPPPYPGAPAPVGASGPHAAPWRAVLHRGPITSARRSPRPICPLCATPSSA